MTVFAFNLKFKEVIVNLYINMLTNSSSSFLCTCNNNNNNNYDNVYGAVIMT